MIWEYVFNVCDPRHIYNDDFKYSLPEKVLMEYLSGKAFDHHEVYTEEQSRNLHLDINEKYQKILAGNPDKEKRITITAGATGAGKSFLLEKIIKDDENSSKKGAYLDPDRVCLLTGMERTYGADIKSIEHATSDERKKILTDAYNLWRSGSNAELHFMMAHFILQNRAIYFGTTSTHEKTCLFFKFLKDRGYKIKLIHLSAPDDVRMNSINNRDETFVQTTIEDTHNKGLLFYQRITDTYKEFANEIEFHYRGGEKKSAVLAARWIKNTNDPKSKDTLEILDQKRYNKIKSLHDHAVEELQRRDMTVPPKWKEAIEDGSQITNLD